MLRAARLTKRGIFHGMVLSTSAIAPGRAVARKRRLLKAKTLSKWRSDSFELLQMNTSVPFKGCV